MLTSTADKKVWRFSWFERCRDVKCLTPGRYPDLSLIPSRSGIYSIGIQLMEPLEVSVRKKPYRLEAGTYVYTGSALGKGSNLHARIARHLSEWKKTHWHIDQITNSVHASILFIVFSETSQKEECNVNKSIAEITQARVPAPGFGSSDCRSECQSHLLLLGKEGVMTRVVKAYELSGLNARALGLKDKG